MDFGLAKRVADMDPNEATLTRDGGLLGTPSYMAPEQVKGDSAAVGPATDVSRWVSSCSRCSPAERLMAAFWKETVVNQAKITCPRQAPPVKESPALTWIPDWTRFAARRWRSVPADRFQSMAELADALGQYLESYAGRRPLWWPRS